jgi:hypothetical protein
MRLDNDDRVIGVADIVGKEEEDDEPEVVETATEE